MRAADVPADRAWHFDLPRNRVTQALTCGGFQTQAERALDIIPGDRSQRRRGGARPRRARHLYAPIADSARPYEPPGANVSRGLSRTLPVQKYLASPISMRSRARAITARSSPSSKRSSRRSNSGSIQELRQKARAAAWLARHRGALVIGSESLSDLDTSPRFDVPRRILSLDFRGDDFLGPAALATNPALWPQRIIVDDFGEGRRRRRSGLRTSRSARRAHARKA